MQKIGKCRFDELPQRYQDQFLVGADQINDGRFIPENHPIVTVLLLPLFFLFSIAPFLFTLEVDVRPFDRLTWIPPLVMSMYAARTMWTAIEVFRKSRQGTYIFGLLIDDENIVLRTFKIFTRNNCVFLPWTNVDRFYMTSEFNEARGTNRSSVLRAAFKDQHGCDREVDLARPNSFELSDLHTRDILLAMRKGVDGEWSMFTGRIANPSCDSVVRFDSTTGRGVIIEYFQNQVLAQIPFAWRQSGPRSIFIEPVIDAADCRTIVPKVSSYAVQQGEYNYAVEVEHNQLQCFYRLRFDRDIAGVSLHSVGQQV
jgi:hypothetical protein